MGQNVEDGIANLTTAVHAVIDEGRNEIAALEGGLSSGLDGARRDLRDAARAHDAAAFTRLRDRPKDELIAFIGGLQRQWSTTARQLEARVGELVAMLPTQLPDRDVARRRWAERGIEGSRAADATAILARATGSLAALEGAAHSLRDTLTEGATRLAEQARHATTAHSVGIPARGDDPDRWAVEAEHAAVAREAQTRVKATEVAAEIARAGATARVKWDVLARHAEDVLAGLRELAVEA